MNSHVDSVTPFRSMILLCHWPPHIINIELYVLNCTEEEQLSPLRRLFLRFACGYHSYISGLLGVNFTSFCLRLALLHFARG